jgi:excinuclease UvrABC ATPase subunit
VEHDSDVIKIADHIVDVGPHAGRMGGEIMFEGSFPQLLQSNTQTGKALNKKLYHLRKMLESQRDG